VRLQAFTAEAAATCSPAADRRWASSLEILALLDRAGFGSASAVVWRRRRSGQPLAANM